MMLGRTRQDLFEDEMLAMAVARGLEIIGEAASKLSPESRIAFPEVPWRQMISMRNILVHAYFEVDLAVVWDTVQEDLPMPMPLIQSAIAALDDQLD